MRAVGPLFSHSLVHQADFFNHADDKERGYEFDGTCHGDGTGGEGQQIGDIMATLTVTVVVVEYSSGAERGTRVRRYA